MRFENIIKALRKIFINLFSSSFLKTFMTGRIIGKIYKRRIRNNHGRTDKKDSWQDGLESW